MTVPLAWRNSTHNKVRALLSMSAITFAVVLIFMQLALYDTCAISASTVTDMMEGDLLITSVQYDSMQQAGSFPLIRLYQARALAEVLSTAPVYQGYLPWRSPSGSRDLLMILGVVPTDSVFTLPEIRANLPLLHRTGTALMDQRSLKLFGPIYQGLVSQVGADRIEVVGVFANGGGLNAGSVLLVSDRTFDRLGFSLDTAAFGLVRLRPGADPAAAAQRLGSILPPDVRVRTRPEFRAAEVNFWVRVKPMGIMFTSGVYVGFIVGAVILYQVLANEIAYRMKEFATMKALGYSDFQVGATVLQQGLVYAFASYLVALLLSFGLYWMIAQNANVPLPMTAARALFVLVLTLVMSGLSGALALHKLRGASPADLF